MKMFETSKEGGVNQLKNYAAYTLALVVLLAFCFPNGVQTIRLSNLSFKIHENNTRKCDDFLW